jgi:hypothetical protein
MGDASEHIHIFLNTYCNICLARRSLIFEETSIFPFVSIFQLRGAAGTGYSALAIANHFPPFIVGWIRHPSVKGIDG